MYQPKRFKQQLSSGKTALLVIDIQERIIPVIANNQLVISNSVKLIKGFKILGIPVFYTEQYPKGLGSTLIELKKELDESSRFEKMSFSCSGAENLFNKFSASKISQVVVCGIEAHVCVQQTVLDLLENNFQVNVAVDAVSSRKEIDFNTAFSRMENNGAILTTTEAILFELLNVCGTEQFKQISRLVK